MRNQFRLGGIPEDVFYRLQGIPPCFDATPSLYVCFDNDGAGQEAVWAYRPDHCCARSHPGCHQSSHRDTLCFGEAISLYPLARRVHLAASDCNGLVRLNQLGLSRGVSVEALRASCISLRMRWKETVKEKGPYLLNQEVPVAPRWGTEIWLPFWCTPQSKTVANHPNTERGSTLTEGA